MTPLRRRPPTVFGIAARVKAAREAKGLTQAQLAEAVGTSRATVNQIELGRHGPTNVVLVGLADALDVTTDHILGRTP